MMKKIMFALSLIFLLPLASALNFNVDCPDFATVGNDLFCDVLLAENVPEGLKGVGFTIDVTPADTVELLGVNFDYGIETSLNDVYSFFAVNNFPTEGKIATISFAVSNPGTLNIQLTGTSGQVGDIVSDDLIFPLETVTLGEECVDPDNTFSPFKGDLPSSAANQNSFLTQTTVIGIPAVPHDGVPTDSCNGIQVFEYYCTDEIHYSWNAFFCSEGMECENGVCVEKECNAVAATACSSGIACPGNVYIGPTGCPAGQECNVANVCETIPVEPSEDATLTLLKQRITSILDQNAEQLTGYEYETSNLQKTSKIAKALRAYFG